MRPIPRQVLSHHITVINPVSVDRHQVATNVTYDVQRVCMQIGSVTKKSSSNTDVTLSGMLFVDRQLSTPRLDWLHLKQDADKTGGDLVVLWNGYRYTVAQVQPILDAHGKVHHYEVGLV